MREFLKLIRPYQYVKNAFIFLPAFFAKRIFDLPLLGQTALAFLAFCFITGSVYILNDYFDREDDRKHPDKKHRPLAAGTITAQRALTAMGFMAFTGISIFCYLPEKALYSMLAYLILNFAYTYSLKHIAILDIFIISLGFLIRLYIGAAVGGIGLSMWINLMTFLLALFLGLAKRRADVLLAEEGNKVRKAIDGYNLEFINSAMVIMASVVIVSYIFYTISVQNQYKNHHLYLTVIFVIMGILRYMQITFVENKSSNPTKMLLKDRFLQATLLGWLAALAYVIYI